MARSTVDLPTRLLRNLQPWRQAKRWRVAFSGGLDSTVLLHLLAHLAKNHSLPALSAIHIHHGLQAAADAWPAHCQAICDALGVPLAIVHVHVDAGASLEQAARAARYGAFIEATQPGDVMLAAQHRDDQAETVLFRLLRGTGSRGLAAMPTQRPLGRGHLLRPLLDVSRAELEAYAREHRLLWIEDPSNADQQFSRNYLRQQVFPVLLDLDHPAFHVNLDRLTHCAARADEGKAAGGLAGGLKRAFWSLAGAAVFARMYFIPVKSNALPATTRLVPRW